MFYVTGDIHGDTHDLKGRLRNAGLGEGDFVLCLGDVGLKYGPKVYRELRFQMAHCPATFLIMRGNYDVRYIRDIREGTYFGSAHADERDWCGIHVVYDERCPNILYLPDEGGAFERNGQRCLVMPGAFSVDGMDRRRRRDSFEWEEQLTEEELGELIRLSCEAPVDYVFSHTCPFAWENDISYTFFEDLDQSSVDKTMEHAFDQVLANVEPTLKRWYFGHFHDDNSEIAGGLGHMLYYGFEAIPDLA